ncbi:MAG: phytanoyl-CoA dioxygenase family protein [Gammaproteobacteria bacterium]|nr:phytanoyl-CoA dioxygenase family protein [Gammaproteobacteria bacterium]
MSSVATTISGYGADESAMRDYLIEGERRAMQLGNRGPVRFNPDGSLHEDIVAEYWRTGFYVFEGVVSPDELDDLAAGLADIRARLPVSKDAEVDAQGRPALGVDCEAPTLFWSKPLGDPFGGTDIANGRHPVKMAEPQALAGTPAEIVYLILGSLQFSDACLRLYGHPKLLQVAAAINGDDFVPFTEGIFIKEPGLGASVAWHQDGTTHWDSPDWDAGSHGFNFMVQLYGCTAANGVWVLPGTHHAGRIDIKALAAQAGSDRLVGAVPMICAPGDVVISNRQILHGSFANTSDQWRVTFNMGFHRRRSVLNVRGGGVHNAPAVYDDARIRTRSRVLGYAIDARSQRFPHEAPFRYAPFAQSGQTHVWDEAAKSSMKDYNLLDFSI